jgi:hypothetical protein
MSPVFLEDLRTGTTRRLPVVAAAAAAAAESVGGLFGFRQTARMFRTTVMRSSHA